MSAKVTMAIIAQRSTWPELSAELRDTTYSGDAQRTASMPVTISGNVFSNCATPSARRPTEAAVRLEALAARTDHAKALVAWRASHAIDETPGKR